MPGRTFKGKVVSNKMQKTVVVAVEVPKKHRFYSKDIKLTKRFKVRDDIGLSVGDAVMIEETRPLSKTVTWKVIEKLERDKKE